MAKVLSINALKLFLNKAFQKVKELLLFILFKIIYQFIK